jgi:hypothetical protein
MNMHRARAFKFREEKKYGLPTCTYPQYKICKNVALMKKKHGAI